jgi:guanine deaminase
MVGLRAIKGALVHSLSFGHVQVIDNGAIVYDSNGVIQSVFDFSVAGAAEQFSSLAPETIDYSGKIICPGFVDAHCHAPQYLFTGTGVDIPLIEWLGKFTFPSEAKFEDSTFARLVYKRSVRRHLISGTTFAAYFATIHKESAGVLAEVVREIGQRAFVGKVSMDRNSPPYLIEDTRRGIADAEEFVRAVLQQTEAGARFLQSVDAEAGSEAPKSAVPFGSRPTLLNDPAITPLVMPCITPRFVPSCTSEMMRALGAISYKYGVPVQSHLSETSEEIKWVSELHPESPSYTAVYEAHNLLHSRTLMAHGVYCTDDELELLKRTGAAVVHCASSNFLLGSGIMDVQKYVMAGVPVALGTDVAGGASASMLDAIRNTICASRAVGIFKRGSHDHRLASIERLRRKKMRVGSTSDSTQSEVSELVSQLEEEFVRDEPYYAHLNTEEAFHLATLGGAEAVGMGNVIGNFLPGKKLDCLVVDIEAPGGPIDHFEGSGASTLQSFEKFIYVGDDRNIETIIVDGKIVFKREFSS